MSAKVGLLRLHRAGFFAHNHFIVTPEGLPLGIWDTDIYARDEKEHGKAEDRKQKPVEEKESYRWLDGYRQACELAQLVPETEVVSCSDREGDIHEVFEDRYLRQIPQEQAWSCS